MEDKIMNNPFAGHEDKDDRKYVCSICGYVYDPDDGDVAHGIAPGTSFDDLPDDWRCPRCKQQKNKFKAK